MDNNINDINYIDKLNMLKNDIKNLNNDVISKTAKRDLLIQQLNDCCINKQNAENQLEIYDKVQLLLQQTSDYAREKVKSEIEDLVSYALDIVFGETHRFIIKLETRANQPVVEYWLDDGNTFIKLERPDYGKGGGKIDVVTLALRLSLCELEDIQGIILLDEVGKHISKEYIHNVISYSRLQLNQSDRIIKYIYT
jgi:hypothetical protein